MFVLKEQECVIMNEMILQINAKGEERALRTSFIEGIGKLIHCSQASFYLSNEFESNIKDPIAMNIDELFLRQYDSHYCNLDEVIPYVCKPQPQVYRYSDILKGNDKRRSEAYNDFFRPMGAKFSQGMNITWGNSFLGLVAFFRGQDERDFSDRELFILRQFQQHLSFKLASILDAQGKDERYCCDGNKKKFARAVWANQKRDGNC